MAAKSNCFAADYPHACSNARTILAAINIGANDLEQWREIGAMIAAVFALEIY